MTLSHFRGEADALHETYDYKGLPALKSTSGGWTSAAMILGVEACERLTTLGIAVNLVTYLTDTMHLGNATSANTVTNFLGTSILLSLLGGFIADTFAGRYLTIAIFATIQATGVIILTISTTVPALRPPRCNFQTGSRSCVSATGVQLLVLHAALYLTALGTGGVKSSVSGFGSDQFDGTDEKEKNQMAKFFHWFFFFINIGSLFAVIVLVYVQENIGRPWGYGISALAILIGLTVFLSGSTMYRYKKPSGSPLTQIASVCVAAWRNRKMEFPENLANQDGRTLRRSQQFRCLEKAAIKEREGSSMAETWRLATPTEVEEVKEVIRMLPVWATTIMFWTIYAQMTTFSVAQAAVMNRRLGDSFQIPAGSLTAFFVGSILLTVPVYDRFVVPAASRFSGSTYGLTQLQRMGVGLVFSILAMSVAALVEENRLKSAAAGRPPMSVFWLVPQFFLVGAGEAFTYVGQLDFFLSECPGGMKTMSTGLFLSTLSLGFFISSSLVAIVHSVTGRRKPWFSDNLNHGRLYDFYWLLAVLSVLNSVAYLFCAKWYLYREPQLGKGATDEIDEQSPSQI